jgi:hypothetical protein
VRWERRVGVVRDFGDAADSAPRERLGAATIRRRARKIGGWKSCWIFAIRKDEACHPLRRAPEGVVSCARRASDDASALDKVDNRHDYGDDQDKMDEAAPNVESEKAEGPKHQQDQSDRQ